MPGSHPTSAWMHQLSCKAIVLGLLIATAAFVLLRHHVSAPQKRSWVPAGCTSRVGGPRTLLVIHGQYRSFDLVVDSIIENLIRPNAPCDVIMALDADIDEVSMPLLWKLQPFLRDIVWTSWQPDLLANKIEFVQMNSALKGVDTSSYDFIIQTRTDVYIARPLAFVAAVGCSKAFPAQWMSFQNAYQSRRPNVTYHQLLSGWFMTGGMEFLIPTMVMRRLTMHWCPISAYEMNAPLLDFIASLPQQPLAALHQIQETVHSVAANFSLMYLVGATWVYFGRSADMKYMTSALEDEYGTLLWNNYTKKPVPPVAATVTEAHMRIAHIKHHKALIDLRNEADYQASFAEVQYGYAKLTRSTSFLAFILRESQLPWVKRRPLAEDETLLDSPEYLLLRGYPVIWPS